jgi:hypothetical protein
VDFVNEKDDKQPIAQVSVDSLALYKRLKTVKVGETITYEELSIILGRKIKLHRGLLYTAFRMAQRQDRMVFDPVIRVGYKRLDDCAIAEKVSTQPFRRIRSTIRRSVRQSACVDTNNLPNETVVKMHASLSLLAALTECTSQKSKAAIEATGRDVVPVGKVFEYLKNL